MATDYNKISFTSKYRYQRAVLKGSTAFSVGVFGFTTYTVAHNLGYKPYFKLFITFAESSGKYFSFFPGPNSYGIGGGTGEVEDPYYVDDNNLYFSIGGYASGTSGTVYHRIYAEQVA